MTVAIDDTRAQRIYTPASGANYTFDCENASRLDITISVPTLQNTQMGILTAPASTAVFVRTNQLQDRGMETLFFGGAPYVTAPYAEGASPTTTYGVNGPASVTSTATNHGTADDGYLYAYAGGSGWNWFSGGDINTGGYYLSGTGTWQYDAWIYYAFNGASVIWSEFNATRTAYFQIYIANNLVSLNSTSPAFGINFPTQALTAGAWNYVVVQRNAGNFLCSVNGRAFSSIVQALNPVPGLSGSTFSCSTTAIKVAVPAIRPYLYNLVMIAALIDGQRQFPLSASIISGTISGINALSWSFGAGTPNPLYSSMSINIVPTADYCVDIIRRMRVMA